MAKLARFRVTTVRAPLRGLVWKIKLRLLPILMVVDEINTIFWKRGESEWLWHLRFPFRVLKYLGLVLFFLTFFGRGAFVILLLTTWFCRLDDVVDGDSPLPEGWSQKRYREQKHKLLENWAKGSPDAEILHEDLLLVRALQVAERLGITLIDEIIEVWGVMQWECERRETGRLVPRTEFVRETTKLDRGVLRAFAKLLKWNLTHFDAVAATFVGTFTRLDWLEDMLEDLQQGIVNIPSDAIDAYGIDLRRVLACKSWPEMMQYGPFATWYREEVKITGRDWEDLHRTMGDDFGGAFPRDLRAKLFTFLINRTMNPALRHAKSQADGNGEDAV